MVWRCRRQRVHRFYLRCYKKGFGEKWSRTRYRFSGRPPPPGTAPHHPRGMQPPQGMQAKETV